MAKKIVKHKVQDLINYHEDNKSSVLQFSFYDKYLLLLIVITAIGAILRIYNLGYQSIWLDEGASFGYIKETFAGTWTQAVEAKQAPLHMIILHFMNLFSSSEFSLRLPSAIFGTLTIPVIYFTGKSLFGKKEGIVSAFLLAISMMHLWYSQEARMYAQMLLFASLSLYFFYVAVNGNRNSWILYVIFSALAFYSHYYAVFVFLPQVVFYLLFHVAVPLYKKKFISLWDVPAFKQFSLAIIALFICVLPLLIPFISQAISRTSGTPTWGVGQSASFIPIMLVEFSTRVPSSSVIFIILFIIGLVVSVTNQKEQCAYLGLYFFIPLLISYILAGSMPFSPRYLLFLLPVYLMFVARGVTAIAGWLAPSKKIRGSYVDNGTSNLIIVSIVFFLLILTIPLLSNYYTSAQKEDWRSTAVYLSSLTQQGDAIVPLPNYMCQPLVYYYSNSSDNTILATGYSNDVSSVSSLCKQYQRCWFLVTWDITAANPDGSLLKWLDNNTSFVNQVTGIYIFTYPKI